MSKPDASPNICSQWDFGYLLSVIGLSILDAGLLLWVLHSTNSATVSLGLAYHAGLCIAYALLFKRQRSNSPFYAMTPLLVFALGPVGGLCLLLSHAVCVHFHNTSKRTFEDWYYELFPNEAEEARIGGWPNNGKNTTGQLKPYIDIIDYGTVEQKRAVVASMARNFKPVFSPALKAALSDPDVRGIAATAAAKIDRSFAVRWGELEKKIHETPTDLDLKKSRAKLLDDYAFLGILEPDRETDLKQKAETALFDVLKQNPNDEQIAVRLARLHIRQGDYLKAREILEPIATHHQNHTALYWYCESLFHLGKAAELRTILDAWTQQLARDENVPAHFVHAAEFWEQQIRQETQIA